MSFSRVEIPGKEMNLTQRFNSLLCALLTLSACAIQRPVLYPNSYRNRVGAEAADLDINDCMRRADAYVSSDAGREKILEGTAISAGTGAAVGGVAGAAGGAVVGRAGAAAAVGAAAGATRGVIRGLFSKRAPRPVYKNFVNRCLREKGYDPIGWD